MAWVSGRACGGGGRTRSKYLFSQLFLRCRRRPRGFLGCQPCGRGGPPLRCWESRGLAGSHPGWLARSILAKAHRPGTHSQPPRWPGFAGPQPPPSSGLRKLSCPTGAAAVHEESGPWPLRRRPPPSRRRPGPEIAEIVASLVGHLARGSPSFRGSLVIEYPSPRDCS